jgi:hypothetical protein
LSAPGASSRRLAAEEPPQPPDKLLTSKESAQTKDKEAEERRISDAISRPQAASSQISHDHFSSEGRARFGL